MFQLTSVPVLPDVATCYNFELNRSANSKSQFFFSYATIAFSERYAVIFR